MGINGGFSGMVQRVDSNEGSRGGLVSSLGGSKGTRPLLEPLELPEYTRAAVPHVTPFLTKIPTGSINKILAEL